MDDAVSDMLLEKRINAFGLLVALVIFWVNPGKQRVCGMPWRPDD